MKSTEIIEESIERFKTSFWARNNSVRPPVGIVEVDSFLPIKYLNGKFTKKDISIEDILCANVDSDYEFISKRKKIIHDDFIPFSAPWRAIPWLEAICGCPVHYSSGSMAPDKAILDVEDLLKIQDFEKPEWRDFLFQQTEHLTKNMARDCWVSPSILRGPSDILAAMRGMDNFYMDSLLKPDLLDKAAAHLTGLTANIIEKHFAYVKPQLGGYGHIYGYWSPEKTNVYQEDAMGMVDPGIFRDIFLKHNNTLVKRLDGHAFFHLHSTGFAHYKHLLEIEGLSGIEITIEQNGPPLIDLVEVFKEILSKTRLILFVDAYFDQLNEVLKQIPSDGLYLLIPSHYIKTDREFSTFINSNW